MLSSSGIIEIDVHGLTRDQARTHIDSRLKKANSSVYRIRVIHGYRGGTELRKMIRSVYKNHPKVKRIEFGMNQGATDLVLRDLF